MQIKLKPYFTFDPTATPPCVRSESLYIPLNELQVALMAKLVVGLAATDVSPFEFKVLEKFNEQGLITFFDHPQHGVIGQHGIELRRALELLATVTVKVVDLTGQHAEYLIDRLKGLGVTIVDQTASAALTIMVADSFTKLPNPVGPTLPVILNRFRPSIGPLMTEWRTNIAEQTMANVAYMVEPNVSLPAAFDDLQRAWAVVNIYQFIIRTESSKVNNVVEFNMPKMKQDWWPVQL